MNIFPRLLYNCLFHYFYSESSLDAYSTVYNYTPQTTVCASYICFLFTMWYFFTITAQFTLQQCLQHVLNIYIQYYLQLHYPVYCICFLHMLPFHNVISFHNHCPIHSTPMFIAYPQHIHTVLFTITLPSILTGLFTFAFLFTMWIFFHSYCIIVYSTMFTVMLYWIHMVLFKITLPSILSVLFT